MCLKSPVFPPTHAHSQTRHCRTARSIILHCGPQHKLLRFNKNLPVLCEILDVANSESRLACYIVDVNECALSTRVCPIGASCVNTFGGFYCVTGVVNDLQGCKSQSLISYLESAIAIDSQHVITKWNVVGNVFVAILFSQMFST